MYTVKRKLWSLKKKIYVERMRGGRRERGREGGREAKGLGLKSFFLKNIHRVELER